MAQRKKDLEIVYNLQWKNKPASADDKSNMVGMCDVPTTTLNWDTFKSYLLKNSGTTGDDVKVSYINSEDREISINSQLDFQIALYSFRQQARVGEIITLKLDRLDKKMARDMKRYKHSTDVQVQVENKQLGSSFTDGPPDWFTKYMKKFKEEIVEEVSATCCSSRPAQTAVHHARKSKVESYKRIRKTPLLTVDNNTDKEKSSKLERKLETKLERLENKTMKIKIKKMALRGSSDSDVGKGRNSSQPALQSDSEVLMNASAISKHDTTIPHMSGGETYLQTWNIINNGKLSWTNETELRYAWGSQAFTPLEYSIPCPSLQPGENGSISAFLNVPTTPGSYECYWYFHHNGRRFGHWLGCRVIVDESPIKGEHSAHLPLPKYDVINIKDVYELVLPSSWTSSPKKLKTDDETAEDKNKSDCKNAVEDSQDLAIDSLHDSAKFATCFPIKSLTKNQSPQSNDMPNQEYKFEECKNVTDKTSLRNIKSQSNVTSDSDNQSVISISDSNSSVNTISSEEFVLVRMSNSADKQEDLETFENAVQKLSSASSFEKLPTGSVPQELDKLLSDLSLSSTKQEETKSGSELNLKTEEGSDVVNAVDKVTETVATSCRPVTKLQDVPIDLSNKSEVSSEKENAGYAYVTYGGHKFPIAKKYLRPDYLEHAEDAPDPKVILPYQTIEYIGPKIDVPSMETKYMHSNEYVPLNTNDYSYCSAAGSSFSDKILNQPRFFVFPQNYPGYEVISPIRNDSFTPVQGAHQVNSPTCPDSFFQFGPCNGEIQTEVLVNDWYTGQNFQSPHVLPVFQNHYANGNCQDQYQHVCRGSCEHEIPNADRNPNVFGIPRPMLNQSYTANTHISSGCTQNSCPLETNIETVRPQCEVRSSAGSDRSGSSQVSSSTSRRCKFPNKVTSSMQVVPENLLTGAAIAATSALNTAKNVLHMLVPPRTSTVGRWENGHWISTNAESKREKNLRMLYEMGFYDRDLNATLLARYNDDINKVISELVD